MSACSGASRIADRRRDALDHRVEELGHALPRLRADPQDLVGRDPEHALDLVRVQIRVGRGQIDLVERRHDLEVVLERQVAVREGLGLDALRRVDDEHHALACGQRS